MSRAWPGFVLLVCAAAGCTQAPASAAWKDGQRVIGPESAEAKGRLVVETEVTGTAENGEPPHAPYYLYGERGRFLERRPHENGVPVDLPVGRYVLVSRVSGDNRRVQIEVAKDRTTVVSLKDFQSAPVAE